MFDAKNVSVATLESMRDLFDPNKAENPSFNLENQEAFIKDSAGIPTNNVGQLKTDLFHADKDVTANTAAVGPQKAEAPYRLSLANAEAHKAMQEIIAEKQKGSLSEESLQKLETYMNATMAALEEFHEQVRKNGKIKHDENMKAANVKFLEVAPKQVVKEEALIIDLESPTENKAAQKSTVAANISDGTIVRYNFSAEDIQEDGSVKFKAPLQFETMDGSKIPEKEQKAVTEILRRTEEIAFKNYLDKKGYTLKDGKLTDKKGTELDFAAIKKEYMTSATDPDARNDKTLEEASKKAQTEYQEAHPEDKANNRVFKFQIKEAPKEEKTITVNESPEIELGKGISKTA